MKLRDTVQRSAILDALRESRDHPTAEQLHQRVRQRVPHVSLGTVYRNLACLGSLGEITRIELAGGPARFDGNVTPHHHIRCSRCSRIDDVNLPEATGLSERLSIATGYLVTDCRVEFTGLCPDCVGAEAC